MKYWEVVVEGERVGGLTLREVRGILEKRKDVEEAELCHVYYGELAFVDTFSREDILTKTKRELEHGSRLKMWKAICLVVGAIATGCAVLVFFGMMFYLGLWIGANMLGGSW